jgi:hypothetical protein
MITSYIIRKTTSWQYTKNDEWIRSGMMSLNHRKSSKMKGDNSNILYNKWDLTKPLSANSFILSIRAIAKSIRGPVTIHICEPDNALSFKQIQAMT